MDALPHIHFVLSHDQSLRISGLNLNNSKVALAHRSAILDKIIGDKGTFVNVTELCSFSKDIKMVRKIVQKQKYLTPIEKDELGPKYESGQSMTAIADEYGCHYTTVGRILRERGAVIRV